MLKKRVSSYGGTLSCTVPNETLINTCQLFSSGLFPDTILIDRNKYHSARYATKQQITTDLPQVYTR